MKIVPFTLDKKIMSKVMMLFGAVIISADFQKGNVTVYAKVSDLNDDKYDKERTIFTIPSNKQSLELEAYHCNFIQTIFGEEPQTTFHIFEGVYKYEKN